MPKPRSARFRPAAAPLLAAPSAAALLAAQSAAALLTAVPAAAGPRMALSGGFLPDPWVMDLTGGGAEPGGAAVRGCPGFTAAAPDLTLSLATPLAPLRFHAAGDGLAGLIVVGPDGVHHCAAPDAAGVATLRVDPLLPGEHAVFPLAAAADAPARLRLLVSERDLAPEDLARALGRAPAGLAADATPAFGAHALPATGGLALDLTLAATAEASLAGRGCVGRIEPSRPDAVLRLEAPEPTLSIRARAAPTDTTLVVVAPDGAVHCADDSHGLDPEIVLADAPPGRWAIWVGLFGGTGGEAAALEIGRGPGGAELGFAAAPAAGVHRLDGSGRLSLPLALEGVAEAAAFGPACAGSIAPGRPDAVIRLDADAAALHLRARSREDTTLLLRMPDGTIVCDDDSYGLDPALAAQPAPAGDYAVWVGAYRRAAGGAEATLEAAFTADAVGGSSPQDALWGEGNPFAGRAVETAADALAVLMEDGLAETLAYERLEPLGRDGFALHDATLTDPTDPSLRFGIRRIAVTELDLAGLAATGEPDRFALVLDGLDYRALAAGEGVLALFPPLPALAGNPSLSLAASLLPPPGEAGKRDFAFSAELDRHFALRLLARLDWAGERPRLEDAASEAISVEFENRGFLGRLLRAQAIRSGH